VAELEKLAANVEQAYGENAEQDITRTTAYFRSEAQPILNPGDIAQKLSETNANVMKRLDEITNLGSSWRLRRCQTLDLGVVRYQPFRGRSYIKTPAYIPPRSVINAKNEDNYCFEWAILSALYPADENANLSAKYHAYLRELNFT